MSLTDRLLWVAQDIQFRKGIDAFVAAYTKVSKDDIRRNRANVGEKLGFLCPVIHGSNSPSWAKELRARIAETPDFAAAAITVIG